MSIYLKDVFYLILGSPFIVLVFIAKLLLFLWDIFFPEKLRELVPYLEVSRKLIFNLSNIFASNERLEIEYALNNMGSVSGKVNNLAQGYILRKGVGQSIDVGLTIIIFSIGYFTLISNLGIPPQIIIILFGSLALALSTFAGLFGPFYGLAESCKKFNLKNGNYRGAAIYKILENLLAIPFNVASAGFIFLDLPPIDADSLENYKKEFKGQIDELAENISSLLGKDKKSIPKKTQKLIEQVVVDSENKLNNLDFRDLRKETAREFALNYFMQEFSLRPWVRKKAVHEFAEMYNFDEKSGRENLILISDKIKRGQLDEDMVNNIAVSAALQGIIMMEEKYQETLADLELGQTCIGLAFGARQFIIDHYNFETKKDKFWKNLRNIFLGIFSIPIVLINASYRYVRRVFSELKNSIREELFNGEILEFMRFRSREIIDQIKIIGDRKKIENNIGEELNQDEKVVGPSFSFIKIIVKILAMTSRVLVFPLEVLYKLIMKIYYKILNNDIDPKDGFDEAVAHVALVSIYDKLFQNLVMQSNVTTN